MAVLTITQKTELTELFAALAPNLGLALAEQLNMSVDLASPSVETIPLSELLSSTDRVIHTTFSLTAPLTVESMFYFPEATANIFIMLLEGITEEDFPDTPTEAQVTRLGNAMAGLTRGLATALANRSGEPTDVEASASTIGSLALPPVFAGVAEAVQVRLNLEIPDYDPSAMTLLFTPDFAQSLLPESSSDDNSITGSGNADGIMSEEELASMLDSMGLADDPMPGPSPAPAAVPVNAGGGMTGFPMQDAGMPRGLELIMDIPLDVTVELGRIQMLIRDVLELSSGSIVELDRVAGEPVDLLVNGRLVAKGEVVVIEDNFGIRITEIISPAERVSGLGRGR